MHLSLDRRSRLFRSFLALALAAWAAFAFDAFAHPPPMFDGGATKITVTAGKVATSHCEGMATLSHAVHRPAPSGPAGNGHGCCHNGGCYCASACSGIVGVPYPGVALRPVHDLAVSLIHSDPVPVRSAPPLRPPIA